MKVRKRTIAGSILVVGVLIGSFLSGLIPGFGVGGNQDGNEANTRGDETLATLANLDTRTEILPTAATTGVSKDVLDVRVEDRSYSLRRVVDGKDVYEPATLDQIIELARATKGNDQGIRVRINRRPSARVVAWMTLQQELIKAGLSEHSVQLQEGLVD